MKIEIGVEKAKNWTTHNAMLIRTVLLSTGPVLEVGGGPFSTPLLHWLCKLMDRRLITYESDPVFFKFAKGFASRLHSIRFIEDWDKMDFDTHWGVVLIDHHPDERRVVDVINFSEKADYIVIHDTEKEKKYGFEQAWPMFKYRYTWKECKPWTTVVSNFKDLSNL
jgi:hypothetical protein